MNIAGIEGESISKSVGAILDRIKYRKYAKKGYTTVIWINKENTVIKLLDGHIRDNLLSIPSQDASKMVEKVYILPSKKIVTRVCIVKEDINSTLDITVTDMTAMSDVLFKKFVGIKLMDDLHTFNLGQVLLGGALGFVAGFFVMIALLIIYGIMG